MAISFEGIKSRGPFCVHDLCGVLSPMRQRLLAGRQHFGFSIAAIAWVAASQRRPVLPVSQWPAAIAVRLRGAFSRQSAAGQGYRRTALAENRYSADSCEAIDAVATSFQKVTYLLRSLTYSGSNTARRSSSRWAINSKNRGDLPGGKWDWAVVDDRRTPFTFVVVTDMPTTRSET